jgi:hypothetical protein
MAKDVIFVSHAASIGASRLTILDAKPIALAYRIRVDTLLPRRKCVKVATSNCCGQPLSTAVYEVHRMQGGNHERRSIDPT